MIYEIDWTHTPHAEDLQMRYWKTFQYIRTAKKFGEVVHREVITVYTRTEYIFQTLIKNWNFLGNRSWRVLNPGLTWHYDVVNSGLGVSSTRL